MMPLAVLGNGKDMSPSIQDVKKQYEKRLLSMPGVVSVGIGLDAAGHQAIMVGMKEPNPETEAKIPSTLEGHPVVIQIIGPIKVQ